MKIKNFSELDTVLKNSFSNLQKDMSEFQKGTTQKLSQTTTKLTQKTSALEKDLKKLATDLRQDLVKHKKDSASTKDTARDNFIKTARKQYDDLSAKITKEQQLTDAKIQAASKEVRNFKKDIKNLQDQQQSMLTQISEKITQAKKDSNQHSDTQVRHLEANLEDVKKNIVKLMSVLREKLVSKETFEKRNQAYEQFLKDVLEQTKDLDKVKLSYFARNSVNSQLEAYETAMKHQKQRLEALSEQLKETQTQQTQLVHQSRYEEMTRSVEALQKTQHDLQNTLSTVQTDGSTKTEVSRVETELSRTQSHQQQSEQSWKAEALRLSQELKEVQSWKSEIADLKKRLERQDQLSQQNKAKIEVIQDMNLTSTVRHPEEFTIKQPERVIVRADEKGPLKSITEFFVEKEEPRVDMVRDVEQMLDQQTSTEEYTAPTIKSSEKGMLGKVKDGLVNFFFEEVEEPETVTFQTPPEAKKKVEPEAPKLEVQTPTKPEKQYMQSRKPRIFEDIDAVEPGSRKKRYKRVDGDEIEPVEDVYYPEDYFY